MLKGYRCPVESSCQIHPLRNKWYACTPEEDERLRQGSGKTFGKDITMNRNAIRKKVRRDRIVTHQIQTCMQYYENNNTRVMIQITDTKNIGSLDYTGTEYDTIIFYGHQRKLSMTLSEIIDKKKHVPWDHSVPRQSQNRLLPHPCIARTSALRVSRTVVRYPATTSTSNAKNRGPLRIIVTHSLLVDVDLVEIYFLPFICQLLEYGRNNAAWSAPCRPEVDHDDLAGLYLCKYCQRRCRRELAEWELTISSKSATELIGVTVMVTLVRVKSVMVGGAEPGNWDCVLLYGKKLKIMSHILTISNISSIGTHWHGWAV